MDPLAGAAIAALVAWTSILIAVAIPNRHPLPRRPLQAVAGLSLGLMALLVLGAPVAGSWPLVFLAGGIAGVWLSARLPTAEQG